MTIYLPGLVVIRAAQTRFSGWILPPGWSMIGMENRLIAELKGCAMAAPPLDEHALPDPLRAAEIGTFTHYSVVERLPDIVQRTLNENRFPPVVEERLRALGEGIPHVPIRRIEDRLAPDKIGRAHV